MCETPCYRNAINGVRKGQGWLGYYRPFVRPPLSHSFRFCFLNAFGKCKIWSLSTHFIQQHLIWCQISKISSPLFDRNDFFAEQMRIIGELYLEECYGFSSVSSLALFLIVSCLDGISNRFPRFPSLILKTLFATFFTVSLIES